MKKNIKIVLNQRLAFVDGKIKMILILSLIDVSVKDNLITYSLIEIWHIVIYNKIRKVISRIRANFQSQF